MEQKKNAISQIVSKNPKCMFDNWLNLRIQDSNNVCQVSTLLKSIAQWGNFELSLFTDGK